MEYFVSFLRYLGLFPITLPPRNRYLDDDELVENTSLGNKKVLDRFTSASSKKRAEELKDTLVGRVSTSTRECHHRVDSLPFYTSILEYKVPAKAYFHYLYNMYRVYKVREEIMERLCTHEKFKKVYFPQIYRANALKEDALFFANELDIDISEIEIFSSTDAYLMYLYSLEQTAPLKILGGWYIESYGNLAGGVILSARIMETLKKHLNSSSQGGTETPVGLSLYHYPQLKDVSFKWKGTVVHKPTPGQFKNYFQTLFNTLDLTKEEELQFIEACRETYGFIEKIAKELEFYL